MDRTSRHLGDDAGALVAAGPVRVNSMSSLSFVRELVKELMEADADEEERLKGKLKMRKILKTRKYPDADGEEHRKRMRKILNTRKYPDEDDDDPD